MPASTHPVQPPPAGRYTLDTAATSVAFVTRHMFGLGRVRGRLTVSRGVVVVADRVEDSTLEVEISAASFTTRNPLRDGQVRSALFLNSRRHPSITFQAAGVRRDPGGWVIPGTLTVKGASAPVELGVTDVVVQGSAVTFAAAGTVDRYALGVTMMRGITARSLTVEITARADLA